MKTVKYNVEYKSDVAIWLLRYPSFERKKEADKYYSIAKRYSPSMQFRIVKVTTITEVVK